MENYNLQDPKKLNKEFLIGNKNFLNDARGFLIERSGYETSDFKSDDDVYDAFMQHFRRQNVNEFTATRDLIYAQTQTDDNGRARMGRLMDTFDHMDGELGWKAAGDYLGGVFTAPSTYAGIFSFGAAKAGALAAQQGVKFGIRQAIKGGARGAIPALAIDAPVAAGTIAAQEQIRKDTGIKEKGEGIDFGKVGTGATISALTSGIIGGGIGARQAYTGFQSEKIVMNSLLKQKAKTEAAHAESLKVFNSKSSLSKKAKEIKNKLALKETIPEALEEGKKLKQKITKKQVKQTPIQNISATIDSQTLDNIAAAGAKIYDSILPRVKEVKADGTLVRYAKGSKEDLQERFSSRITRALLDQKSVIDKVEQGLDDTLAKQDASIDILSLENILKKHNVSLEQLGLIYAEEVSEAGRKLGTQSKVKRLQKKLLKEMNDMDGALQSLGGDFTAKARTKVQNEKIGLDVMGMTGRIIDQIAVKGRVGLMTIQAVTTARNTTNGYMRNYSYALDNLGSGLYNVIGGNLKRIPFLTSKQLKEEGRRSVRLGVAQLKTSAQAALLRDLVLGTTSVETAALEKLFKNPAFGKSEQAKELFKEMGDIGNLTGTEGGLTAVARKLNIFNTMSDNMFKRAIFSRELNKLVQEEYGKNLKTILMEGNFQAIDDKLTAKAMEQALEFTYQAGKFHKKEGWFNKIFANGVINFGQSRLGSLVIPFPRYLINQFRFFYEHAPIIGMFDFGSGILNKSTVADRVGKQLGGITTLYAFMQMRANLGTEDTGAFEFYSPTGPEGDSRFKGAMRNVLGSTGGYFDLKATLGPYAMTAWLSDFMYRMMPHQDATTYKFKIPATEMEFDTFIKQNPRMAKGIKNNRIRRDLAYALTGGLGRAGTASDILDIGIDTLVNGTNLTTDRKAAEYFYKLLANALNTYTVGAGVFKDTAAIISPNFRKVPNNTDVSVLGYFAKQATRAFPQIADPTGVDSFKGIDNDVDGMNIFNTGFVYKGVGPDRKGFSATPYRSTGITYVNPLLKQATGLFEQEEKTFAQKEFDRLGFDYVELIPRRVQDDTELNNDQKQVMSTIIESTITNYIAYDTTYKKSSDLLKRRLLTVALASAKQMARKIVLDPKGAGNSYTEIRRKNKAVFYSLPQDLQKELREQYKTQNDGEDLVDIEDFGRALAILEEMPSKRRKAFLSDPNYQDVLKGFKGFD
tara:strand:+ start:1273 stop:4869 length:3597 start_codon:yes stop_codon:yes gene_type:complete